MQCFLQRVFAISFTVAATVSTGRSSVVTIMKLYPPEAKASRFGVIYEDRVALSFPIGDGSDAKDAALLREDAIPSDFDLRSHYGHNTLAPPLNQHQPMDCGACWIMSSTLAIADAVNIARRGAFPKVFFSQQPELQCDTENSGCHGGYPSKIPKILHKTGLVDFGCAAYAGHSFKEGVVCPELAENGAFCQTCAKHGATYDVAVARQLKRDTEEVNECTDVPDFFRFKIKRVVKAIGAEDIARHIMEYGTVVCSIFASDPFETYSGGIWEELIDEKQETNHMITLVGFGTDAQTGAEYWIGRNQWGTPWGEQGFFRIQRGQNTDLIESDCLSYIPDMHSINAHFNKVPWVKHWDASYVKPNTVDNSSKEPLFESVSKALRIEYPSDCCGLAADRVMADEYIGQLPDAAIGSALPDAFSWHHSDDSGFSALSTVWNQYSPRHCNAAWAFAIASTIADRWIVAQYLAGEWQTDYEAVPSVQAMIAAQVAGDCTDGDPLRALRSLFCEDCLHIGDETCSLYRAQNAGGKSQDALCYTCFVDTGSDDCAAIDSYDWFQVTQPIAAISGTERMKYEIRSSGPIACAMRFPPSLWHYTAGIYDSDAVSDDTVAKNHIVSVVGWGFSEASQRGYWLVRNSFGQEWGELGFLRIWAGANQLEIESECYAPTVRFQHSHA